MHDPPTVTLLYTCRRCTQSIHCSPLSSARGMRYDAAEHEDDARIKRVRVGLCPLACCCAAAFALPLALLTFFETGSGGESSKGEIAEVRSDYLSFQHASVNGRKLDTLYNVSDERACAQRCDAAAPRCVAFSYSASSLECIHHAHANSLRAASARSASVRRSVSWPLRAAERLRWEHNATLVLAWSGGDVGWLRRLPPVLDIAVIAVAPPMANESSASRPTSRGLQPAPRELLRFGLKLKYYAALPLTPLPAHGDNGGSGHGDASSGAAYSAATALAAVSFITTFYHNLPPLIILADERCGSRVGCDWISALGSKPADANAAIARAITAGQDSAPSEAGCMCHLQTTGAADGEAGVSPRASRWFEAQFIGEGPLLPRRRAREAAALLRRAGSPRLLRSPVDGPLALSSSRVRSRPHSAFLALYTLLVVDDKYPSVQAHTWAKLLHARWLHLMYAGDATTAALGEPGGADNAGPFDPCFYASSVCGTIEEVPVRARLRARSAQLFRGAREAVRSGIGTMRSNIHSLPMPQMPSVPDISDVVPRRVRERVRGWWRTARDRTGY